MDTTRKTLLQRIADWRDEPAWREFDALYRPLLCRYACARGLDASDADDLAQQTLAAVAQHIHAFDYDPSKGSFRGWLRTLMNNNIRKRFRGPRALQADSAGMEMSDATEAQPDQTFERIWLEEHLRFALERIRPEFDETTYRAFELHVLEEQSVQQVCDALGVNANQVYKAKGRITQRLDFALRMLRGDEEHSS